MATAPIAAATYRPRSDEAVAYVGLSLASLCWASAFITGKLALAELTPLAAGAWRYTLATIVLLPFALRARRHAPPDRIVPPLIVMIVCGGLFYQWLFLLALERTSATNTSLLIALNPALTTLLSPMVGERLDRRRLGGVAVALFGALTVITKADPAHLVGLADLNDGDLLAIAAAGCWASFNLASRRVAASLPASVVNGLIYGTGAVTMFALGQGEHPWAQLAAATPTAIAAVAAMAVFSSVLGGQFFLFGVRLVGVNRTVVFVYLIPVLTAFLSVTLLGERFHVSQAIGGAAVMAGVYLTTRGRAPGH